LFRQENKSDPNLEKVINRYRLVPFTRWFNCDVPTNRQLFLNAKFLGIGKRTAFEESLEGFLKHYKTPYSVRKKQQNLVFGKYSKFDKSLDFVTLRLIRLFYINIDF